MERGGRGVEGFCEPGLIRVRPGPGQSGPAWRTELFVEIIIITIILWWKFIAIKSSILRRTLIVLALNILITFFRSVPSFARDSLTTPRRLMMPLIPQEHQQSSTKLDAECTPWVLIFVINGHPICSSIH
jgi:hypothetical protein